MQGVRRRRQANKSNAAETFQIGDSREDSFLRLALERPIDGVDGKSHAEPYEHPLPIASRYGDERKQREGGPSCGQEVNRRGA